MGVSDGRQVPPARQVLGRIRVPGDKSISHRLLMLAGLAEGVTRIDGLAPGDDCSSTRACLVAMGVEVREHAAGDGRGASVAVRGGLRPPPAPLDAGNSGTTARLLMGLIAGRGLTATITGDPSLRRRPMSRVIDPLSRMGAAIRSEDGRLPATVLGGPLTGLDCTIPVASAQVKSAVLLAGLQAEGRTTLHEVAETRDHTEIALRQFGARLTREGLTVSLDGRQRLTAVRSTVPGDVSSAAFWAAAAAGVPGSRIEIEGVGLNPTRTAFLTVLERMGAEVRSQREDDGSGEAFGTLAVAFGGLKAVEIGAQDVPGLIDELPVLAALATHGGGITVRGASELRVKESDRIAALVEGLRALGACAEEFDDGFAVDGSRRLRGGVADAAGDHRLAMAFAIAALGGEAPSTVTGAEAVSVSYPGFFDILASVCA